MYHFFLECDSLFLRHGKSGKCIATGELVYQRKHAKPYFAVMIDNCLNSSAQFRFLENELLHNIEKDGTLVCPWPDKSYKHRWAIYKGLRGPGITYQSKSIHRLKQTDAGRLLLYNMANPVCAEPQTTYVIRKKACDKNIQRFTFGKWYLLSYLVDEKFVYCIILPQAFIFCAPAGCLKRNISHACSHEEYSMHDKGITKHLLQKDKVFVHNQ